MQKSTLNLLPVQVTRRHNLLLHVDACLGGFVLPFARQLGYPIPPFDFSVKGVTSMSVDTHKFGMAHKGTSVVLYHSKQLRQYQYTKITEWTGGLYISPGQCSHHCALSPRPPFCLPPPPPSTTTTLTPPPSLLPHPYAVLHGLIPDKPCTAAV